jgi:hypothetical protein
MVIESLTTEVYHNIYFFSLSQFRTISIFTSMTVKLGAIFSYPSGHSLEDPVEIAYIPNLDTHVSGWRTFEGAEGVVTEGSWTWYFILFFL